jgi:hypothetical protein
MKPTAIVREQQRQWASSRGIEIDDSGYTTKLSDNLFTPLSAAAEKEYRQADGGELGSAGKRGKMQALHSSSSLTYNVFEHWRSNDSSALADALNMAGSVAVRFERKFPTRLPGKPPNIDVELRSEGGPLVAIECKFLEPYRKHVTGFKQKYFESEPGLWQRAGYPRTQALAESLQPGQHTFKWLHAEQLLKHVLGLAHSDSKWRLIYLWYHAHGPEAAEHTGEVERFARTLHSDGIDFIPMTYQSLFQSLSKRARNNDVKYIAYLRDRYFADLA